MSAPSDLTGTVAGLKLDKLDVAAARLDQPVQVSGQGSFDNVPATRDRHVRCSPGVLSGAGSGPVPIDLRVQAAGSTVAVKGTAASGAGWAAVAAGRREVRYDRCRQAARGLAPAPPSPPVAADTGAAAGRASRCTGRPSDGHVIPDTPIPFDLLRPCRCRRDAERRRAETGAARLPRHRTAPRPARRPAAGRPVLCRSAGGPHRWRASRRCQAAGAAGCAAAAMRQALRCRHCWPRCRSPATPPASWRSTPTCTAPARRRMPSPAAWTDRSAWRWPKAPSTIACSAAHWAHRCACQPARSGRPRRQQRDRVLRRPYRRQSRHRHAAHLLLASSLLTMDGDGSMNLGAETLDLHVRPQARVAGAGWSCRCGHRLFPRAVSRTRPAAAVTANAGAMAGLALLGKRRRSA